MDRKKIILFLSLMVLAVLAEVFIFNNRTFQTAGYHEQVIDVRNDMTLIGGRMDENGVIWIDPGVEEAVLVFSGPDMPVKNVKIDVECVSEEGEPGEFAQVCSVGILAFDDLLYERINPGGSSYAEHDVLAMISGEVLHSIGDSQFIYLNPFGDTHTLVFSLGPLSDKAQGMKIHEIKFNAVRPLMVIPLRILLVFVSLLILHALFSDSFLWKVECVQLKKRGNIVLICLTVFISGVICWWRAGIRHGITGDIPEIALIILLMVLIGKLIYMVIVEYYKQMPIGLFLVLWVGIASAMFIPALASGIDQGNHLPNLVGTDLLLLGLYALTKRSDDGKSGLKNVFSGACLAAACMFRPVFMVYGLVILVYYIWDKRKTAIKIAFGVPFVVGVVLYAVLNLMRIDILPVMGMPAEEIAGSGQMGGFLPYVIYRASYEYLFKPPYWDMEFPFTEYTAGAQDGVAGSILTINMLRGGMISSNPFTFLLLLMGIYRKKLKEKKLLFLMLAGICAGGFIMIYDTLKTGTMCIGYTLDFSFIFAIPAAIMLMELYEDSRGGENERIRRIVRYFVTVLLLVSAVWGIMQLGAVNPENLGTRAEGSELWYRLFYAMRVLR